MSNRGTAEKLYVESGKVRPITATRDEARPLRECAETALRRYFADLHGQMPENLYDLVLAEIEQPLLKTVLEYTRGNQSSAARILGINRSTLRKKLRQYGLNR
ncbi:MAG TPA: DNA-binding transcriptional regulator Fis [Gammaproteobacteria bacterium]|nr:DNA-binding transcriptional regulator Fis [Gammaproteobacteria bacterium]